MIKYLSLAFFLMLLTSASAQQFELPKAYQLDKAEDYDLYEKDILSCIDWLMNTPFGTETFKRKEANAFLLKWLTGSPKVKIEIKAEIVNFMENNPDLLLIFLGGWAKYSLISQDTKDKVKGNLKGLEAVVDFYRKNQALLKKDKNVEKYAKMKEKGTLEDFIKKNL